MKADPRPLLAPCSDRRSGRRRVAGFSLIEIIIVLAIVGVVIAIAIPNLLSAQQGFQMSTGTASAANRLSEARFEAVKRNRRIDVTIDAGARSLLTTVTDAGGVVNTLAGPEYLPSSVVYDLGGAATLQITFDSMGRPLNPPQVVTLRSANGGLVRVVTVLSTGRVTVQ
jgi:prepilin-type N-terminal cleavage/methylation domain-containing protein